jgi:hypothetical protein
MLQEHLEHIEAEVGQRGHTGAYAMLVMFKYVSQPNQQLESIYQASEYYHQHYGLFCSQCQNKYNMNVVHKDYVTNSHNIRSFVSDEMYVVIQNGLAVELSAENFAEQWH